MIAFSHRPFSLDEFNHASDLVVHVAPRSVVHGPQFLDFVTVVGNRIEPQGSLSRPVAFRAGLFVSYDDLTPDKMVVVDFDGRVVEGDLKPSSDTPTHLVLYRSWPQIGGIVHTHSAEAVMFAQACRSMPCLGTTHADHFFGEVPCTRPLSEDEVENDYEEHTGTVITERFAELSPVETPAVLVANHGPFAWGKDADTAVKNSVVLEEVAKMARGTLQLAPETPSIPAYILRKHYLRKHGPGAYYGQQ